MEKGKEAIYNTDGKVERSSPEYYSVDFSKVKSFNDLILVLGTLKTGLTMYPDEYEVSPIKIFLNKTK